MYIKSVRVGFSNEKYWYSLGESIGGQKITSLVQNEDRFGRFVNVYLDDKCHITLFNPEIVTYGYDDEEV